MTNIRIPRDAAKAVEQLADIGALVSAKEWHRAAIVAALVGPPRGKGNASSGILSPLDLAAKGIVGLRSHTTIERYRDYWCNQRPVPTLGDTIDLDGLPPWPGVPNEELAQHTSMTPERRERLQEAGRAAGMPTGAKVVDIAANPKALRAAIEADPATAQEAEEALMNRTLASVGLPPLRDQGSVPDPVPRWRRITLNVAQEIRAVLTEINDLHSDGQHALADKALAELRDVLIDGIARCEVVPDTPEGIDA